MKQIQGPALGDYKVKTERIIFLFFKKNFWNLDLIPVFLSKGSEANQCADKRCYGLTRLKLVSGSYDIHPAI